MSRFYINQFGRVTVCSSGVNCNRDIAINNLIRSRGSVKKFSITNKQSSRIKNAAATMWLFRGVGDYVTFGTVTFVEDVGDSTANSVFKLFAKNICRKLGVREYVAVRENTKIGRPHYHILMLAKFIPYVKINQVLCEAMWSHNLGASENVFTTNSRNGSHVVVDINGCVRYVTSYISKSKKSPITYETKCYFISNGLQGGKSTLTTEQFSVLDANFKRSNEYLGDGFHVINYEPFPFSVKDIDNIL